MALPHRLLRLIIFSLLLLTGASMVVGQTSRKAILLTINGAIGPAVADYISRGITTAQQQEAKLVIIKMDTPGGLDQSMRQINKAILASALPIISFVAPSGARAASAGTFILYASHIAAMAPGTSLGAASPVSVGGGLSSPKSKDKQSSKQQDNKQAADKADQASTMSKKVFNDAIAYIRSLAQLRGRNAEWAEKAVRDAATLTAAEAEKQQVINIVATNVADLIAQLDGKTVTVQGIKQVLETKNLVVESLEPDWRAKFLAVITDPSVAYILLLIGVYGLFFEFANPGFVVPGVVGAIALLLAMYAFQLLPINYAGLGLIFLGIIFMVGEAFMPSFGALGIGGVIAFIVGSILLFDRALAGYKIAWPLIFGMALANAAFFILVVGMAIKARRQKVVTGREDLLGQIGQTLEMVVPGQPGYARIRGERWQIISSTALQTGDSIKVTKINGLTLEVEPHSTGE